MQQVSFCVGDIETTVGDDHESNAITIDVSDYMSGVGIVVACGGTGSNAAPLVGLMNEDPHNLKFYFYCPNVLSGTYKFRYAVIGYR